MRRNYLSLFLIAVLSAIVAASVMRCRLCPSGTVRLEDLHDVGVLSRSLELSTQQCDAITAINRSLSDNVKSGCSKQCAMRMALAGYLRGGTNSAAVAREAIARMYREQADCEMAALEHLWRIRAELTPAQREKFDAMFDECLGCASCAKGEAKDGQSCFCSSGGKQ